MGYHRDRMMMVQVQVQLSLDDEDLKDDDDDDDLVHRHYDGEHFMGPHHHRLQVHYQVQNLFREVAVDLEELEGREDDNCALQRQRLIHRLTLLPLDEVPDTLASSVPWQLNHFHNFVSTYY